MREGEALRRPGGQGGYSLIELMVAVTLFALVFAAVSLGMGRALDVNRSNRNRSTAAYEAARQLEEVRAAAADDFNGVTLGRTVTTRGLYTIAQDVSWVSPSSTSSSCNVSSGSSGTTLAYKRVTVTVTWPNMKAVAPVTSQTLLTPPIGAYDPADGHVAVQLFDRNALPLANHTVTLSGPESATQLSTEDGCAFFAYLDPGTYSLSLNTTGWVGRQGDQPAVQSNVAVQASKITKVQMDYDRAATLQVTLAPTGGAVLPSGIGVTMANTNLTCCAGKKVFSTTGSTSLRSLTPLFPYASGYEVWAGECADADPGSGARTVVSASPGGTTAGTVALPAVRVTVQRAPTTPVTLIANATVSVQATHANDPSSCTGGQSLTATAATDANGQFLLALPYGTWTLYVTSGGKTGSTTLASPLRPPPATGAVTVVVPK